MAAASFSPNHVEMATVRRTEEDGAKAGTNAIRRRRVRRTPRTAEGGGIVWEGERGAPRGWGAATRQGPRGTREMELPTCQRATVKRATVKRATTTEPTRPPRAFPITDIRHGTSLFAPHRRRPSDPQSRLGAPKTI